MHREGMAHQHLPSDVATRVLRSVALPDVCRVEDLAEHLQVSTAAIRRALRRGELPGRRVGRRWLISRLALVEWLSSTPPPSADEPRRHHAAIPHPIGGRRGQRAP